MTILGKHTISEVRDLIKVVDFRVQKVDDGFKTIPPAYISGHPDDYRLLSIDWNAVKQAWKADVDKVSRSLILRNSLSPAPADMIAAEDEYKKILGYVEYGASSGVERRAGDLRDCNLRIDAARGAPVDLSGRPDMNSSDTDMEALKKLDASIKAAKQAVKSAATSNTGLLVLGGLGLVVGGIVIAKVYL